MKVKRIVALYYLLGIAVLSIINSIEALILLSIVTYSILADISYTYLIVFFSTVFIVALPSDPPKSVLTVVLIAMPYIIINYRNIKTSNPIVVLPFLCLIAFKFGFGVLALLLTALYYMRCGDYRYFIGCSIILLIASAYILSVNSEKYANDVAIVSYYMLVIGVFGALLEYLRENKTGNASNSKLT